MMDGDNKIKVSRIRREGYVEYRVEIGSVIAVSDYQSNVPPEFIAATLANHIREFVNGSVLGEVIDYEYRKLGDSWTCPYCGSKVVGE